jgi:mono/diheme cytochrome c family protein
MRRTIGFLLQNLVDADQPLVFDGSAISNERWPWSEAGYQNEPQRSATWDEGYQAFKRGEQLALPYYAPRATDPQKQAQLTEAYASYRDRQLSAAELPDLAAIFPDDGHTLAEIGLRTEPDATPAELLIQACGSCHNDVLDQSISRARFNIALGRLPASELAAAVARLRMDRSAPGAMPPPGRRQLDEPARARLIAYLEQRARSSSPDDELLERVARLGMAQRQPKKPLRLSASAAEAPYPR